MGNLHQAQSVVGPERIYFDGLAAGRFQMQRCGACDRAIFYPRCLCPHCGGTMLSWFTPSGKGVVYASTTVYRKQEHGGNYNVCLVDLDEGVRMMSRIRMMEPEQVRIGMQVVAQIEKTDDAVRVVFVPAGSAA